MNRVQALLAAIVLAFVAVAPAHANHAWANYHWARTANPFTLKCGDNVTSQWDSYLVNAAAAWSRTSGSCVNSSNPVRVNVVAGSSGNVRRCGAVSGTIQACNASYGGNGWLGLASIWANGDHITQGTVKLNDYYFNTSTYNTPDWRCLVMAQEVGHCFGLGHQDEDFYNADVADGCGIQTCMDYTNTPAGQCNPNGHDYDQLVTIYGHLDATTTIGAGLPDVAAQAAMDRVSNIDTENQGEWGNPVHFTNGKPDRFERDFGNGIKLLTRVIWTQ